MDGFNLIFWIAVAGGGYAFYPPFRKWVNIQIVKIADKIKADAGPSRQETNPLEDVAFEIFKSEHYEDPRTNGEWHMLPEEVRKEYILRAVNVAALARDEDAR